MVNFYTFMNVCPLLPLNAEGRETLRRKHVEMTGDCDAKGG